ncbi:amino acid ABC transporter permease [Lonepinella koalarum]|uniref:Polar amino acid transport system permease protein/L-cystine transport system permease protein n=1 Tax=Lonepinella koalarum TaxID=53417 RepID=A0A4R1L4L0_9PAST|nr:amino acid ABC transporter permease [Lonepinella koalarum]MDH2926007.1 amino acid ABC transporter permease [Lonepinella koalarum]TCK71159.1 polar amino acid transport system permease protein/L-cystine transport system permease protein [Lonepinella koalarum]TFJ90887.1 amino acid ABC transporter permease [Lonepinella koalarum]TYG34675.1 amino acid ABC transporter permease [Lonepinella koalarum]
MENLFKPSEIINAIKQIIPSIPITLEIAVIATILGLLGGFILALIRINKIPILYSFSVTYISFMRGTPLLVQIFLSYYGIPILLNMINLYWGTHFNINRIPSIIFVYVAFSLNEAAYLAETIRSAILSVDKKDIEAAHSIGMTKSQIMRRIILPQAMIVAIPNLGNIIISLIKSTSLAFTIGVMDMMGRAKAVSGNSMRFFEAYIGLALLYWLICIVIEFLIHKLEHRFNFLKKEINANDQIIKY